MGFRLISLLFPITFLFILANSILALPYGAVAQWDYNETQTPFRDNWNNYNCVWLGSTTWNDTYPSFNISGSGAPNSSHSSASNYCNVDDIFPNESIQNSTSNFTWQTWAKQTQSQSGGYIMTDNLYKTALRFDNSQFQVWVFSGSAASNIFTASNNVWYFIGLKCENGNCWTYYSSGGALVNQSINVGSTAMGNQLYISGRQSSSYGLRGFVDRTQIFNVSLSWEAIKDYYNYGNTTKGIISLPGSPLNGSGTAIDPYELTKCEHIYNISFNESAHYELLNDLNCENMTDIYNTGVDFRGFLYGRNHTISNYYINYTLLHPHKHYAFFNSNGGYIENLIINNFSITARNSSAPAYVYHVSIFGNSIRTPEYKEVAVKNSYLKGHCMHSVFGVGSGFNITSRDTYVINTIIDPEYFDWLSPWHRASYATEIGYGSDVRTSWVDVIFSCPGNENGSCFMGKNRGIMRDNYYNNETCNDSCHLSYGAMGISSNTFIDPNSYVWENYSKQAWYFESGYHPIFMWEYEQMPRPVITTPNASINANYDDLQIYYTVFDTNSLTVACDLYLDGSINQTDSSVTIGANESFYFLNVPEGLHSYYISCSDGVYARQSETFSFNVDTTPPQIISQVPPSNGSMLNYSFIISGNITDPNLFESNYSLYYPNGSLLYYSQNSTWNKSLNVSPIEGIYNIKISAIDSYNNSKNLDLVFYVNDTVPPVCFGFSDSSVYTNSVYTWAGLCLDERLMYSFNISCSGAGNYNYTEIGINSSIYPFTKSYTFPEGNTTCFYEACDGHTAQKLKEKWYIRDNKKNLLEFEVHGRKNKLRTADDSVFTYTILEDRIGFNISFNEKKGTNYIIYYETSENSHYYRDEEFTAWIIDYNSRTWFDLNSPDNDFTVKVMPWNITSWRIELIPSESRISKPSKGGNKDIYRFNSIGELNCIKGNQSFISSAPPPKAKFILFKAFKSIPEALSFFFIFALWLVVRVIFFTTKGTHHKRIQIFNIFSLALGFTAGMIMFSHSPFLAIPTLFAEVSMFMGTINERL